MEYYPKSFEEMFKTAIDSGAEYLILGQHYLKEERNGDPHTCQESKDESALKQYVDCITEAMERGIFTYVAHPDVMNFTGDASVYAEEMRKICVASKKLNIPLEINFLGLRENRIYPTDSFWEIAGDEQSPVTFGFDAHSALSACDDESLVKAKEMVKKYNLNYIGKPELIPLKQI